MMTLWVGTVWLGGALYVLGVKAPGRRAGPKQRPLHSHTNPAGMRLPPQGMAQAGRVICHLHYFKQNPFLLITSLTNNFLISGRVYPAFYQGTM